MRFSSSFCGGMGCGRCEECGREGEGDSFLGRFLMREKLKKVLCGVSVSHQVVALGGGRFFWDL